MCLKLDINIQEQLGYILKVRQTGSQRHSHANDCIFFMSLQYEQVYISVYIHIYELCNYLLLIIFQGFIKVFIY